MSFISLSYYGVKSERAEGRRWFWNGLLRLLRLVNGTICWSPVIIDWLDFLEEELHTTPSLLVHDSGGAAISTREVKKRQVFLGDGGVTSNKQAAVFDVQ